MFDNKYPYTDFHELNLDWILEVVKRVETEWPEFKTTMETEWNTYKDGLTGEGGEWPTFKTQVETIINNFIHDVVGNYNENLDYKTGMFCYYEGNVYKCNSGSSAAFPRPFNSYSWFSYAGQNTNSIVNDLFNYLTSSLDSQDTTIIYWIQHTAAQWDETTAYKVGDYCSAFTGSVFNPGSWRYYKCIQACTGVNVLDTNYWKEVIFASDVAETIAAYKQAMQDQYDQFLEDYQRTFGVVQVRGSSTTDVMSQKAVSDELQAHDDMLDNLIKDIAPVYDFTNAYKIGNLLTYLGKQYYCIADAPAGTLPTNTSYFEEKSVADIIEMIKAGTIPVGLSDMAKNLTPYSKDSGAIQDTPFISQETGTANNSVIVTTGDTAKQLEKLGNAAVYNQQNQYPTDLTQWGTSTVDVVAGSDGYYKLTKKTGESIGEINIHCSAVVGHKVLFIYDAYKVAGESGTAVIFPTTNLGNLTPEVAIPTTKGTITYFVREIPSGATYVTCRFFVYGTGNEIYCKSAYAIDLTQWFGGDANIPQDLLANPSHFSWYCNGELTFNAGEIKHGEGVKLVCTRGRNLWDETWGNYVWNESAGGVRQANPNAIGCEGYIRVVPNKPIRLYNGTPGNFYVLYYDANKNYLSYEFKGSNSIFNVPANAYFATWYSYNSYPTTYKHDITFTPYYTEQEGGEGYDQYYPYKEPDIIDTGSEQLGAFDKKTPDGVIERNTGRVDLGTLNWRAYNYNMFFAFPVDMTTETAVDCIINAKYTNSGNVSWVDQPDKTCQTYQGKIYIRDTDYQGDATAFKSAMSGVYLEYPLKDSAKTTEQGTSFRQYAGINDYGIMYWLDANDELVSIPQGCKIQYPVNYKGFTDDLYMYTNGDVTKLAKNESITDAALQARGYLKLTALSGYDANKTQTLKNVQGVFTWVDD